MKKDATVLRGSGTEIAERSENEWREELLASPPIIRQRLDFMTPTHHRIRNFVVRCLGEGEGPIAPESIAESLALQAGEVERVLRDLERGLFFLVRDLRGRVSWAFPFTADRTLHRVDLGGQRPGRSSGRRHR